MFVITNQLYFCSLKLIFYVFLDCLDVKNKIKKIKIIYYYNVFLNKK